MGNNASKYWLDASMKEEELFLNEELTFQNGYGRYLWRSCTKNAGHENFIPAKEFRESHLPTRFQNGKVLSLINTVSDLTVRIIAKYTSEQRPLGDRLYEMKGMDCRRFGSGMVIKVVTVKNDSSDICTCAVCMKYPDKPKFTARVHVSTACHVVFDATEAEETEAELFYDDEKDRKSVKTLYGSKVLEKSEVGDTCVFECITHDKDLADTLMEKLHSLRGMEEKLGKMSLHSPGSLSVVASHPHGASKHISIGEIKQLQTSSMVTMKSRTSHDLVEIDGDKAIFILPLGQPCIQMRHDMANENEKSRHDMANENEESRHDMANENEESRHDMANENKESRHDMANENEESRHDMANENEKSCIDMKCNTEKKNEESCIQIRHDMVNKNGEAEATGILVHVCFPDETKETLNIWQLGEPVQHTKKWLLEQAGFHRRHQDYILVIDLPDGDEVEMDDVKPIDHYWDDLTRSAKLWFKELNNFSNSNSLSNSMALNGDTEYRIGQLQHSPLVNVYG